MNIKELTPEMIRKKLAGLVSSQRNLSYSENTVVKSLSKDICVALASVFSDDLDRKTLWDRIGSALITSIAKTENYDIFAFFNHALDHVKASSGAVASNEYVKRVLSMFASVDEQLKKSTIDYIQKYHFLVVVEARQEWQLEKKTQGVPK